MKNSKTEIDFFCTGWISRSLQIHFDSGSVSGLCLESRLWIVCRFTLIVCAWMAEMEPIGEIDWLPLRGGCSFIVQNFSNRKKSFLPEATTLLSKVSSQRHIDSWRWAIRKFEPFVKKTSSSFFLRFFLFLVGESDTWRLSAEDTSVRSVTQRIKEVPHIG